MIPLKIQIGTLLFSFQFGFLFSLLTSLLYHLFKKKKFCFFITTIFYIFLSVYLYFISLKKIDNGIIHIYFLGLLFLGIFTETYFQKNIEKILKKWYNQQKNRKWKNGSKKK